MDFQLTPEQEEFKAKCRRFARDVIRPVAAQHDADESTPWEVMHAARREGLEGPEFLEQLAADSDGQAQVIHAEELHWGCAGIATAVGGTGLAAAGLASAGTPAQISEWLPRLYGSESDFRTGAYAVTEAQAGSDVRSLRTMARRDGDQWVLDGTKVFITNGGIADTVVVVASVDLRLGHRGHASFIVPAETPGFRCGKKEDKLGIRASDTSELIFEDCRVPIANLLGGVERLEKRLERARRGQRSTDSNPLATFERTRPIVGASAVGIAQAAYEWTLGYLDSDPPQDLQTFDLERRSSTAGAPVSERQRIQQVLAQVGTEIEAARMLARRGAWMARQGKPMVGGEGSMAKLKGGEVAVWATQTLMDLVGPFASTPECPLEKWFRDAKIYQLFEGTTQIQRLVIARMQAAHYRELRAGGHDNAGPPSNAGTDTTSRKAMAA